VHASEHEHTTQVFVIGEEHMGGGTSIRTRTGNTGVRHWSGTRGRRYKCQNTNTQHRCSFSPGGQKCT